VTGHDAASGVLDALRTGDAERLRLALHPYLRWTTADGDHVRGRGNVLALLRTRSSLAAPAAYELRDGQVYRWQE
jgi:hypothetical protein